MVRPQAVFCMFVLFYFYCSIFLQKSQVLFFYMNFRVVSTKSVKNFVVIWLSVVLNLQIPFGRMAIHLPMLILPVYEYGMDFHQISTVISFFKDLKFLVYKFFACLLVVPLRYFVLFEAILGDVFALASFSVHCYLHSRRLLLFLS